MEKTVNIEATLPLSNQISGVHCWCLREKLSQLDIFKHVYTQECKKNQHRKKTHIVHVSPLKILNVCSGLSGLCLRFFGAFR